MAKVIMAPEKLEIGSKPSVFLAGSIDMGNAVDWQKEVTDAISHLDIVILNPRRKDWDSSWEQSIDNPQFREQVEWELEAQEKADLIIMYFDPKGKAPITLLELGLFCRDRNKMIVCCPDGYWRKGNVDVVCNRYGVTQLPTLKKLIAKLKEWSDAPSNK